MIPKHPNSRYKTDTAADKLFLGVIALLTVSIISVCGFFLLFTIVIKIGFIGLFLTLLGLVGFFVLSYFLGDWLLKRIEGRR